MNEEMLSKEFLQRYLLGALGQHEAETVEARCFADPEQLCELVALRDDLLDALVCGELPPGEAQQLSTRLQTLPALRDKAAFARSLQQALAPQAEVNDRTALPLEPPVRWLKEPATYVQGHNSWYALPRLVWAAAALLFVLLVGWFGMKAVRWRASHAPEQTQSQTPVLPSEAARPAPSLAPSLVAEIPTTPAQPKSNSSTVKQPPADSTDGAVVVSFVLAAGSVRAEQDAPALAVSATAKTVRLQLELAPPQDRPQRAVLKNALGAIVWQQSPLRIRESSGIRVAICDLPAHLLAAEAYQLHLSHPGAVAAVYYFRFTQS